MNKWCSVPKPEAEGVEDGGCCWGAGGVVALEEEAVLVPAQDEVGHVGGGGDAHGDTANLEDVQPAELGVAGAEEGADFSHDVVHGEVPCGGAVGVLSAALGGKGLEEREGAVERVLVIGLGSSWCGDDADAGGRARGADVGVVRAAGLP